MSLCMSVCVRTSLNHFEIMTTSILRVLTYKVRLSCANVDHVSLIPALPRLFVLELQHVKDVSLRAKFQIITHWHALTRTSLHPKRTQNRDARDMHFLKTINACGSVTKLNMPWSVRSNS